MNFEVFEAMYQKLWKLIYDILAVFGYAVDENGDLVKAEDAE